MSSFLHVFLAFAVVFTFFKDYATQSHFTPESQKRPSKGEATLVPLQERLDFIEQSILIEDQVNFEPTSQQRQPIHCQDCQSDESGRGRSKRQLLPLEVQVRKDQQKVGRRMCDLLGALDRGYKTSNQTQAQGGIGSVLQLGKLGRRCKLGFKSRFKQICDTIPAGWLSQCPAKSKDGCQERERERQRKGAERPDPEPEQSFRACVAFSARRWLHALGYHGFHKVHAIIRATSQSLRQPDASECCERQARVGRTPQEGVPGPDPDARGHQALHRESGAGVWETGYQKPAPSHEILGQGQKAFRRSHRPKASPSLPVDVPLGERYQGLGKATRRLQTPSGDVDGTGWQGESRNHRHQSCHPTTEQHCSRGNCAVSPSGPSRAGRYLGGPGRQGGGCSAEATPRSLAELCGLLRFGCECPGKANRDSGGRGWRRGRQAYQKAALIGAIWYCTQTAVSGGRAQEVLSNSLHEAIAKSRDSLADAYQEALGFVDAACGCWDDFSTQILPLTHSIVNESRYVSPFQASLNALELQWEVCRDSCDPAFQVGCRMPVHFPFLRLCHSSQRPHARSAVQKQVSFEDHIDVLIGDEDVLEMGCMHVSQSAIHNWKMKPWSKKRVRKSTYPNNRLIVSQEPLSNLAVLSRDSITSHFDDLTLCNLDCVDHDTSGSKRRITKPKKGKSLAPLSSLAVSSRHLHIEHEICRFPHSLPAWFDGSCEDSNQNEQLEDASCFVQVTQFKQTTHSDQEAVMLDAFSAGHTVDAGNDISEEDLDSFRDADGNSDTSSASSGVRPPSSAQGRQEVIMFQMRDPPIRAFLDWSDYHRMISEIAYHFSTDPTNVVDAYEINTQISGLPPDAIPIIVHLLPDIAIGQTAKLVLFDLEIHAHSSEPSFRLGPATQRFVHATPEWCDRRAFLTMADAEIYCHRENDRCFVWYDGNRWPDTDAAPKHIAHGDHIRVALPPTERFACPTQSMVRWTQAGLTDDEILHQATDHEASAGYSPSLLEGDEVRELATPNILVEEEDDVFLAMQSSLATQSDAGNSTNSDSVIPEDWYIDLQRIVRRHADQCIAPHEQFLVSVYTWLIDHQDSKTCYQPKIVFLGEDPAEWFNDILHPWRFHIAIEDRVFLDIVQPSVPRSDNEDHIAHVIITKRPTTLSSILLSLEFVEPREPNVIVRFATALSRQSNAQEIATAIPLFATLDIERLTWQHPVLADPAQAFSTRNGMGILIQINPQPEVTLAGMALPPLTDVTNLMQVSIQSRTPLMPIEHQKVDATACKPSLCSFTDDFLEAVAAHQEADQMDVPLHIIPDPRTIEAQPEAIRDLWERFQDAQTAISSNDRRVHRVESWFLNHVSFTRCHESRVVLLQEDFLGWMQAFVHTWQDKLASQEDISLSIVHPIPEDAMTGILAQIIVTQNPLPESRSAVLSVYDTDPDLERSPHTFALVLPLQIDRDSLLRFLNLWTECTLPDQRNQCTLSFGRIPIANHMMLNVHAGHAYRLLVSRGEPVAIEQLLAMTDPQLREVLQRARQPEIFIRPDDPSFFARCSRGVSSKLFPTETQRPKT